MNTKITRQNANVIYTRRRLPARLILVGLFVLAAALIILPFIPVTLTFWGSSCGWTGGDTTTCEPVAYHTTRPIWLWLTGGGW